MIKDIITYVSKYDQCQKSKNRKLQSKPLLQNILIPEGNMKQVGIDLTQLPEVNGYKYLVVLVDYFSKWIEAEALTDKSARTVGFFFYKQICHHGCFEIQINDQGREFVNEISKGLYSKTGTIQRITSAYHPQANGLVERQNQTIKCTLVKVLDEAALEWPYIIINDKMTSYMNQSVITYLNESGMSDNTTCATDAEIIGCASFMGIDIKVYSKYGEELKWLTYM